jgi:hypothetical protein
MNAFMGFFAARVKKGESVFWHDKDAFMSDIRLVLGGGRSLFYYIRVLSRSFTDNGQQYK